MGLGCAQMHDMQLLVAAGLAEMAGTKARTRASPHLMCSRFELPRQSRLPGIHEGIAPCEQATRAYWTHHGGFGLLLQLGPLSQQLLTGLRLLLHA